MSIDGGKKKIKKHFPAKFPSFTRISSAGVAACLKPVNLNGMDLQFQFCLCLPFRRPVELNPCFFSKCWGTWSGALTVWLLYLSSQSAFWK